MLTLKKPKINEKSDRCLDISPGPVKKYGDRIEPAAVILPVRLKGQEQTDQKKSQKIAKSVFVVVSPAEKYARERRSRKPKCFWHGKSLEDFGEPAGEIAEERKYVDRKDLILREKHGTKEKVERRDDDHIAEIGTYNAAGKECDQHLHHEKRQKKDGVFKSRMKFSSFFFHLVPVLADIPDVFRLSAFSILCYTGNHITKGGRKMTVFEWTKLIIIGIVEGITEWLPVSSTAHMLLIDEIIPMAQSEEFKNMFFILIQLGAIMAVVVSFWKRLWPFGYGEQPGMEKKKCYIKKDIFMMWFKVVVACIPGFIVTMLFDDYVEAHLQTPYVIGAALAAYGLILILVESSRKNKLPRVESVDDLSFKDAFIIGLFQCLSIIPGTSRSGSTIIGSLSIGINRTTAAEFTFFMAVPVMFGLSFIKILKFGFDFTSTEIITLLVGCAIAFLVSLVVIRALMNFVKKHDYKVFGYYRILLGVVVILYFALAA